MTADRLQEFFGPLIVEGTNAMFFDGRFNGIAPRPRRWRGRFAVVIACVLAQSAGVASAQATAPWALWSFDEGTGEIAADTYGNGADGTIAGAKWVRGLSGTALQFGATGDWVEMGADEDVVVEEFAISFWARWGGRNGQMPIENLNDAGETAGYVYFANGSFYVNFEGDKEFYPDNEALVPNGWALYTVTFSDGTVSLYVNGTPVGSDRRTYRIDKVQETPHAESGGIHPRA